MAEIVGENNTTSLNQKSPIEEDKCSSKERSKKLEDKTFLETEETVEAHDCSLTYEHEASVKLITAGQIRARCSSAKNSVKPPISKLIETIANTEFSDSGSDVEISMNISNKSANKKSCFLRKSPGLACRLSEDTNNLTNPHQENIELGNSVKEVSAQEEGKELHNSETGQDAKDHDIEKSNVEGELSNCENRLIRLEREEKLEKIARIDLLYQKQIESEMNAGIAAHLSTNEAEETDSFSSHVKSFATSKFENVSRKKKPIFYVDFGGTRRKPNRSHFFAHFPGKSVNLPSVEDGLSSGNVSGDDDHNDDDDDDIQSYENVSLANDTKFIKDLNHDQRLESPAKEIFLNSAEETLESFECLHSKFKSNVEVESYETHMDKACEAIDHSESQDEYPVTFPTNRILSDTKQPANEESPNDDTKNTHVRNYTDTPQNDGANEDGGGEVSVGIKDVGETNCDEQGYSLPPPSSSLSSLPSPLSSSSIATITTTISQSTDERESISIAESSEVITSTTKSEIVTSTTTTTTPATDATMTPATDAAMTSATDVTTTPATDAAMTPATDATTTPATDATSTPATDAITTPATDATTTPATDATATPATDATATPATDATATDATTTPATDAATISAPVVAATAINEIVSEKFVEATNDEVTESKSELQLEEKENKDVIDKNTEDLEICVVQPPRMRVGSDTTSPPVSLEPTQKLPPPQSVEIEVFELQPILGIPRKSYAGFNTAGSMIHRSPSPSSGKTPASNLEIPTHEKTDQEQQGRVAATTDGQSNSMASTSNDASRQTSADVESAIRDIKSAIMKSKNIKLSSPQQIDELITDGQTEPVWITRQPQDFKRSYNRAPSLVTSSSSSKIFKSKQDTIVSQQNNTKSDVASEDEDEDFMRANDNYATKDMRLPMTTTFAPQEMHYCSSFASPNISMERPIYQRSYYHLEKLTPTSPTSKHIDNPSNTHTGCGSDPLTRSTPDTAETLRAGPCPFRKTSPATQESKSSSSTYSIERLRHEEAIHVPNRCDRYDCHECRDLPDKFDDEDDDDDEFEEEEEDDDENGGVVNSYGPVAPKLDIASPCRIHGNNHQCILQSVNISHNPDIEISTATATHGNGSCSEGGVHGNNGGSNIAPKNHPYEKEKKDHEFNVAEYSTDEETDNLLKRQYNQEVNENVKVSQSSPVKNQIEQRRNRAREVALRDPSNESVLIEGVLFRANYLGSTQLISEGQPSRAMRMMQAQEAVSRIKASDGESQPSTEVDLFVSVEKIMVLNTNLQEIMMDHALRTISYIADIGDILVIMARRGSTVKTSETGGPRRTQTKICCHVFESDEAQLIAQSIGQAFQVSYVEFLKANGIEEPSNVKSMDYQEVLNQQEVYGEELYMLSNKEMQREVIVSKTKGEPLGIVIVESGWGSMIPTVVLANMAPCGASARCNQLNIGDQIISINGISMVGLPLTTCQNYIKAAKSQSIVKLTVVSCPPVVEVLIKRPDVKYQLGFSVQNGVICSLLRGGIAERGGIRVGHRIIEINGQSVVATPHEKIVNMLATSAGEIHMKTMPTSIFHLLTGQIVPHYI